MQEQDELDRKIMSKDYSEPMTSKVFWGIVLVGGALVFAGMFLGWSPTGDQDAATQRTERAAGDPAATRDREGKSPVYWFFHDLFAGIDDGLEDGFVARYNDVDEVDMGGLGGAGGEVTTPTEALIWLDRYAEAEDDEAAPNSISAVIGSTVMNRRGDIAGEIHDIIIDPANGEAETVIVDIGAKQVPMSYERVMLQNPQGDTWLDADDRLLVRKPDFDYETVLNSEEMISLRLLAGGEVLDFQDNIIGQIETMIFDNGEVQQLYFRLRPSIPAEQPRSYLIPLQDTQIIRNPDGYDVRLNRQQTEDIAEDILE